jgi:hypothetical protein
MRDRAPTITDNQPRSLAYPSPGQEIDVNAIVELKIDRRHFMWAQRCAGEIE